MAKNNIETLGTFDEWKAVGYRVRKGEKAKKFQGGYALFDRSQVEKNVPKETYSKNFEPDHIAEYYDDYNDMDMWLRDEYILGRD